MAEYNTLLISLEGANEVEAKNLEAYSDSMLIDNLACGKYKVRHENLIPYHEAASKMEKKFNNFYIRYYPSVDCT